MEGFLSFCSLLSCLGGLLLVTPTQKLSLLLLFSLDSAQSSEYNRVMIEVTRVLEVTTATPDV
jgi:hypothetical protein